MFWHNKLETMHVQVYKSKHIPTSQIVFLSKTFHMMHIKKKKNTRKEGKQKPISCFLPSIFPSQPLVSLWQRRAIKLSVESSVHTYRMKLFFFSFKKKVNKDLNLVDKQIPEQRSLNSFREKGLKIFA